MKRLLERISGRLHIQLTEDPVPITEKLANLRAPETARIVSLRLDTRIWERDAEGNITDERPLTEAELAAVALAEPEIRIAGYRSATTTHRAANGASFTLRELLAAVEERERQTRGTSEWFDGVDVHHVFFEGLDLQEDGTWLVHWGS